MIYKEAIGDYPCEYWWVRYASACTLLKTQWERIWEPIIKELKEKYGIDSFAYQGIFHLGGLTKKQLKVYLNSKIIIRFKNCFDEMVETILLPDGNELYETLREYISQEEQIQWYDCPYQNDHQSKCPFYKVSRFYKDKPLEELRQHKGYEL
jgi:hypothetical protein